MAKLLTEELVGGDGGVCQESVCERDMTYVVPMWPQHSVAKIQANGDYRFELVGFEDIIKDLASGLFSKE